MSGHSKWATIKHKKGAADKARGKLFAKLSRQIEVAVKGGGGDIESNASLRTVVQKAKAAQMTKDAIDRAVKRGMGETGGANYETIMYEGYAPGGVALLVDVLTDNRNRTAADVRSAFTKFGGSMAEPGAVSWQFSRRGLIMVPIAIEEDTVMTAALEAGADDIEPDGDSWRILTDPSVVYDVKDALEAAGIEVQSAESTMVSSNTIEVTVLEDARQILRIMDMLEDNDDVQDVFANFDIDESLMQEID
ncbi:MAG: YebC/PmpR family DNA-binding transcriptional regulator [Actinobacteria bacterium]|jgi:YebC/PmpR family DNA-binding regulatory protein|nr:YebC/PmpR family DNA-binding transcriptional regulator [Actinomycetota bacterium]